MSPIKGNGNSKIVMLCTAGLLKREGRKPNVCDEDLKKRVIT
jgi:hypothetical protein